MSLLLQALQKAAKSRKDGDPATDPLDADELALEPIQAEPTLREETPAAASAGPTPAQAATVMQASRAPAFDPIEYAREHYMIVFIGSALLFAAGYGAYVYIQVSNPGLFRSAPRPAPVAAPLAAAPASQANSISTAAVPQTAKISGMPASAAAGAASAKPEQAAAATAPQIFADPAAAPAPKAETPRPARASVAGTRRQAEPVAREVDAEGVETLVIQTARSSETGVRRDSPAPAAVDPVLMQAYEALQAGDFVRAKTLYAQVLHAEPRNADALLGMGAIAWKEGRAEEAGGYYQRVLQVEPRNAYAQAGLISIIGGADPQASETRLKQLIAREPSAFLYFTLGNLYADQGQWPAAQQAYFQAYQSQSDNADYAFNLAVGLEHLGQIRPALDYYRKALDLSFKKGRANFDQNLVIQRVGQLSARVEQ